MDTLGVTILVRALLILVGSALVVLMLVMIFKVFKQGKHIKEMSEHTDELSRLIAEYKEGLAELEQGSGAADDEVEV